MNVKFVALLVICLPLRIHGYGKLFTYALEYIIKLNNTHITQGRATSLLDFLDGMYYSVKLIGDQSKPIVSIPEVHQTH